MQAEIAQLGEQQTEVTQRLEIATSGGRVFNPRSWHFFYLLLYR